MNVAPCNNIPKHTFTEMANHDPNASLTTHLSVDAGNLAEWVVAGGSSCSGYSSDERPYISVGRLICDWTSPANIHNVETRLHAADKGVTAHVIDGQTDTMAENLRPRVLTGYYGGSRAGVASSQRGGWELRRGWSAPPHRPTTSSSAGSQTPGGRPSPPKSHCLPDSSPSSPGIQRSDCWSHSSQEPFIHRVTREKNREHDYNALSSVFGESRQVVMRWRFPKNDEQWMKSNLLRNMNSQESLTCTQTDLNDYWRLPGEFPPVVCVNRIIRETWTVTFFNI